MKLSNDELFILSDGILSLIKNCSKAVELVQDKSAQKEIKKTIAKYQELNSKLLNQIDENIGIS